jgi:plasmid stabilization system protein ParE
MKLVWSDEALEQLAEIEAYIARDNPIAAERFVGRLIDHASTLVDNPRAGRMVPEHRRPDLRELVQGNYRIVCLLQEETIEVVTVFEAHQALRPLRLARR